MRLNLTGWVPMSSRDVGENIKWRLLTSLAKGGIEFGITEIGRFKSFLKGGKLCNKTSFK